MTSTHSTSTATAQPQLGDGAGSVEVGAYPARRVRRLGVAGEVRDERIVHELDGILGAVDPRRVGAVGAALWRQWTGGGVAAAAVPDLLLGLDAGGIPPTVAVSLASGVPYQLAWKLDLDLSEHKVRFVEPHARRTEVFCYAAVHGRTVLLVDDEVTTGRTLLNLVTALRGAGARVAGALCLVEDTGAGGRALLAGHGVALCALTSL